MRLNYTEFGINQLYKRISIVLETLIELLEDEEKSNKYNYKRKKKLNDCYVKLSQVKRFIEGKPIIRKPWKKVK